MKKDIDFPQVQGVNIAIVPNPDMAENAWLVYLINYNDFALSNVLVSSRGYSTNPDKPENTSVLRHSFPLLEPQSFVPVETIMPAVFHLCNEYWLSYYYKSKMYDKKHLFLPESITQDHLRPIALLNKSGILHG